MKILVIGDSCVDKFIYGSVDRICPEAPVPVFNPIRKTTNPGMAGNVIANLFKLRVETKFITNNNKITKTRYVDEKSNQMLLRVDENDQCSPLEDKSQLNSLFLSQFDGIIISDYNKGFLTNNDIANICENHPLVFIDTKRPLGKWVEKAMFIKLNQYEYNNNKEFLNNNSIFKDKLIITMGDKGCMYKNKLYPVHELVEVQDVSGAGDTFLSAFTYNFITTKNIKESINFGQHCASSVVSRKGVVTL